MGQLLEFICRLREAKIQFMLDCQREAIMVTTVTPLAYYEIEFFADGGIALQRFEATPVEKKGLDEIIGTILKEMGD